MTYAVGSQQKIIEEDPESDKAEDSFGIFSRGLQFVEGGEKAREKITAGVVPKGKVRSFRLSDKWGEKSPPRTSLLSVTQKRGAAYPESFKGKKKAAPGLRGGLLQ